MLELSPAAIERDFGTVRGGYEPAEVDSHLRELALAAEELASIPASRPLAASRAEVDAVQTVIDAASSGAEEIRAGAQAAAGQTVEQAQDAAALAGEEAMANATQAVRAAEEAGERIVAATRRLDGEVERVLAAMRSEAAAVAERLRRGSELVGEEMAAIGQELRAVRADRLIPLEERPARESAQPAPAAEPRPAAEPDAAERMDPLAPSPEAARLHALNMALAGSPREETGRHLVEHFALEDPEALLDEVYGHLDR